MSTQTTTPETEITEAQAVAFLVQRAKEVQAKFGNDEYATVILDVLIYSGLARNVAPRVLVKLSSGAIGALYEGPTFADAVIAAEGETPEKIAAKKRAEAARLLAEADKLSPTSAQ